MSLSAPVHRVGGLVNWFCPDVVTDRQTDRQVLVVADLTPGKQSRQWVDGSCVNGSNASLFWMGHVGHGSVDVDP